MSNRTIAYVFGYGSLVCKKSRDKTLGQNTVGVVTGRLNSVKRSFDAVGMGNSMLNHKYFTQGVDSRTRLDLLPAFKPAFANARITRGSSCLGAFIPVDRDGLSAFDGREANYTKVDVTHLVPPEVKAAMVHKDVPVYMYTAKVTATARVADGDVFIPSVYLETVRAAFATVEGGLDDFTNNTNFCGLTTITVGLPWYLEEY